MELIEQPATFRWERESGCHAVSELGDALALPSVHVKSATYLHLAPQGQAWLERDR